MVGALDTESERWDGARQARAAQPPPCARNALDTGGHSHRWNAYAYLGDTPLEATDPLGLTTTPDPSALYTESQDYVLEATQGFEGSANEFTLQSIPVRYIGAKPDPIFFFTDVSAGLLGYVSETVRIYWTLDPSIIGNGAVLFGGPDPAGLGAGGPSAAFAPNNAPRPQQPPEPPQHFWQKPGCSGALGEFGVGLVGSALTTGAVAAAFVAGPEEFAGFEGAANVLHVAPVGIPGLLLMVYGGVGVAQRCF